MSDKKVNKITWPRNNPHIYAQQGSFGRGIDIAIFMDSLDGEHNAHNVVNLIAKTVTDGDMTHKCLTISNEAGKHLMDQLWLCGIRPTGVQKEEKAVECMENHIEDIKLHLQDFRNLAFNFTLLKGITNLEKIDDE